MLFKLFKAIQGFAAGEGQASPLQRAQLWLPSFLPSLESAFSLRMGPREDGTAFLFADASYGRHPAQWQGPQAAFLEQLEESRKEGLWYWKKYP